MFEIINPWAILIASIAAYLVGWAWYSPILWAKPWLEARGKTPADMKDGMKDMPKVMAYGFVSTLATAYAIAVFLAMSGVTTLLGSLQVGLLLCFGFVVTTEFGHMLYTASPPHWGRKAQQVFFIDIGYQIVLFMIVSSVIWFMSR